MTVIEEMRRRTRCSSKGDWEEEKEEGSHVGNNGSVNLATLDFIVRILASKAHLGVDVWVNVHAKIMQSVIM